MTELLERIIEKVKVLPDEEQDALASIMIEEIQDEERWTKSFARSQDFLAELAKEAVAEYSAGKTKDLNPDSQQ